MKKILVFILICAMLASTALFLTGCGDDEEQTTAYAPNPDWETILIGVTDYIPMNFRDENNNWTGFETEFAQEVGRILELNVDFIIIDWSALILEVNAGTVDAIWNGMSVLPQRQEAMDISIEYMRNRNVMIARAEDAERFLTPEGAADASIVVEGGSAMERMVTGADPGGEFFFADLQDNVTLVTDQPTSIMEVLAGTADIAVVDYVKGGSLIQPGSAYENLVIVDVAFPQNNFAVGLRQGSNDHPDAKLRLDDLNRAIQQLKDSGWLMELAQEYGLGELLIIN
jgi:polar amino acid transport system substrate-binding protein